MRSSVSMVILFPSRNLCTSLPSLTARRPKVDSAMSASRQNCDIWLRISSFFIARRVLAKPWDGGGQHGSGGLSYHHLPNRETDGEGGSREGRSHQASATRRSRPPCA